MDLASALPVNGTLSEANLRATSGQPQVDGQAFMTLLLIQLQHQDPFQPLNPTEMVDQMVQLNVLNELVRIRQLIEGT